MAIEPAPFVRADRCEAVASAVGSASGGRRPVPAVGPCAWRCASSPGGEDLLDPRGVSSKARTLAARALPPAGRLTYVIAKFLEDVWCTHNATGTMQDFNTEGPYAKIRTVPHECSREALRSQRFRRVRTHGRHQPGVAGVGREGSETSSSDQIENRPPRRPGASCRRGGVRYRAVRVARAHNAHPFTEDLVG